MAHAIIIERKKAVIASGKTYTVYLDDTQVGKLKNGERMVLYTTPGSHTLTFKAFLRTEATLPIRIGANEYELRLFARADTLSGRIKITGPALPGAQPAPPCIQSSAPPNIPDDIAAEAYTYPENRDKSPSALTQKQTIHVKDELTPKAAELSVTAGAISTADIQRKLDIGYARADRIIDELAQIGIVGPRDGSRPRYALWTVDQLKGAEFSVDEPEPYDCRAEYRLFSEEEESPASLLFENLFIPKCGDEDMYAAVSRVFESVSYSRILLLNTEPIPFTAFNDNPRLLAPIHTTVAEAKHAIQSLDFFMRDRYAQFANTGVRNLRQYNDQLVEPSHSPDGSERIMPRILVVLDELATVTSDTEPEYRSHLSDILLHGCGAGIHILAFSYRAEKESNLKGIADLFHTLAPSDLLRILHADTCSPIASVETELSKIDAMSTDGWKFERYAANLLMKCGFVSAEVTSGSNDYGVDIVARDQHGVCYAVQCKCYTSQLGSAPVQEVSAGMIKYRCQVGVVLSNQYFTRNAAELAAANNILLWDRDKLTQMIGRASSVRQSDA